jgi:hypothetical protein
MRTIALVVLVLAACSGSDDNQPVNVNESIVVHSDGMLDCLNATVEHVVDSVAETETVICRWTCARYDGELFGSVELEYMRRLWTHESPPAWALVSEDLGRAGSCD